MPAMSYLVLARKYRPQTFEEVIGQEHVTKTLQNAIRRGRIHHAFLFCGGRGTGKTTTARILAKALSCVNAPTPEPCNRCEACIEITQGTSVDVQEIDAASQNRVEDIRDLRESIRYAPVRGKKKLYILDEVHMLSTSAFNALLKTLEEPPPHAVFVFATTDPHKLPQTILSRVQRYDFKLVPTSRLVEHLGDVLRRENIEYEPGALYIIAREGAGSVRDSLSLLDQVLASAEGRLTEALAASVLGVADRGLILSLGQAIAERNPAAALTIIDDAYQRGFDLPQLARTLLSHLRDLVVVSLVKDPQPLLEVPSSELPELERQAQQVAGRVELLFDRMVRVADETSRASLSRYVLEVGLVELCAVEPLQPIGELVDRLEQLEDRLAGRPSRGGGGPPSGGGLPSGGGPREAAAAARSAWQAPPRAPMPERKSAPPSSQPAAPPTAPSAAAAPPAPVWSPPPVAASALPPPAPPAPTAPSVAVQPAAPQEVVPPPPDAKAVPSEPPAPAAVPHAKAVSSMLVADLPAIMKKVFEKQPSLAFLREARALSCDNDRLLLGLPSEFLVERARELRPQVQALLREDLGPALSLEFVQDKTAAEEAAQRESLAVAEERARTAEMTKRRREAVEHQSVKLVREVFGEVSFQEPELENG
jgi:DNA polymerase-3 subunit gamma/tau